MANANVAQESEVKELVVDARFIMRSFDRNEDGKVNKVDFLSFELVNPFSDEDFVDVPLKAKWDKFDDKGRLVRPDRVFGWMSYYAKKALKTNPEVLVKATIKPVTYKSKKTGDKITYAGIFVDPTFVELEEERPVEVVVKGADKANTFILLAGKALGIRFTPRDENDEDIGL